MLKNVILKVAAALLVAAFAVDEVEATGGFAPLNPEFRKWRKRRDFPNRERKEPLAKTQRKFLQSGDKGIELPMDFGYVPTALDRSYLRNINDSGSIGLQRSMGFERALPEKYDLRVLGRVTPVKDQNPYGTCWAHATLGSLESWLLTSAGKMNDFSEKHLANTHGWDLGFDDGGNDDIATAFLTRWSGPIAETEDPYPDDSYYYAWLNGGADLSLGALKVSPSPAGTLLGHVQQVKWITPLSDSQSVSQIASELIPIKQAIMECGGLYANYGHVQSYYKDVDGYMDSYYLPASYSGSYGGHAVLIVGWDDKYSKANFKVQPPGDGAFIVKNSWGTWFGVDGYFYVSYYDKIFAKDALTAFCNFENVDNYARVYQHDPFGRVTAYNPSGSGNSAWGANVFTAVQGEMLAAVGFYAFSPGTKYLINIYRGCSTAQSSTMPISGTLVAAQQGVTAFAGFVTIPLASENQAAISIGQRFSIVLQLTTPGWTYPLALEGLSLTRDGYGNVVPANSEFSASSGESFISINGSSWYDLSNCFQNGSKYNFCCKAYTKSASARVDLSNIKVSGVGTILSGGKGQLACRAMYSDGSEKDVTDKTTWSIADGRSYASVSSSGLVTAKEVDAQQTVKVHAKYTEGSVTKENDWSFFVTIAAPQPPTGLTATEGTDASCIRVNWTAPSGASSYAVYRSASSSSGSAKFLEPVTITRYADTDESLVPGVDYWYFIKAKNDSGTSGYSEGVRGWRKLSAPENVSATDGTSLDNVTITWSEVRGAKYYRVYRSAEDETEAEAKPLGTGWQTATKYVDSTAQAGVTYLYYVKAAINGNGDRPSDLGIFDDGFRSVPVTLDSISIDGASSIAAGGSATYTCTATYTDKSTKLVSPTWEIVGGSQFVTRSGATLTAKPVTGNQVVTLKATYTDGVKRTANKSITITAVKPSAPKTVTLKGATTEGVSISWTSVSGASAYSVWRGTSTANAKKIVDALTGTEYTDVSGEPGVAYTYWVKASNAAGESAFSTGSVTGMRLLSAPTGVVASDGTFTDKTTVTWKLVPGAAYYRVARAESQTGTKTELGSWQTVVSYSDANGTAGKRYWYFVKAATSSSGANASAYGAGDEGWRKVSVTLSSIAIGGVAKLAAGASTVFSCTATYSDGTRRTVTPTWSVSGSGTIDASGKFTAAAVTADSTATVTARYTDGTSKTATHEVKIVVPVKATAEIASVKPSTRWPFSGKLDVDYELKTTPEGTRALVSLSGFDNDKQTPMAAKTLSGDGAEGAVAAGKHRLTWDVAADYPNFHAKSFGVEMTAVPMTANMPPSNVTASAGTSTAGVNIAWAAIDDAAEYEVWRNTSSATNGAERIKTTDQVSYIDTGAAVGNIYYYWVLSVTEDGKSDFGSPVSGWRALAAPTNVAASDNTLACGVRITWDAVEGADGYAIYRGTSTASGSATQVGTSLGPAYVDSEVASGTTSYYFIKATSGSVTSEFSAYDKGSRKSGTPLYVVVDLSGGTTAGNYPISELSNVPSGGWTDEYKTNKLVLRRIANGLFTMGGRSTDYPGASDDDLHQVTISKPFYMGVFEVAQRQYELVMGSNPSLYKGDARPVENVSYNTIRGSSEGAKWPSANSVDSTSFMGKIRARTGITIDLPTEAQWEYACRAGTTTALNSGKNLTSTERDLAMDEVGCYTYNYTVNKGGYTSGHKNVGSYQPNNWGLYDMHGNVAEWCLDWYQQSLGTSAVIDPKGTTSGTLRVLRGGNRLSNARNCRSCSFLNQPPSRTYEAWGGFRLCCPAGL